MIRATVIITLTALAFPATYSSGQGNYELSPKYERWLKEEVIYIITSEEKDVFLKLDSNDLRDRFIVLFWEKRDPTPGTVRNEFQEEHYERIEFANKNFSPRGQRNGWRTERGRIYIIFGQPKERLEFPSDTLVYPLELWFYSADGRIPGVSFFYMLFFKRSGAGDYVIYHPKIDGPSALTWRGNFEYSDEEVMQALEILHYEVAKAAISLNPLDPAGSLSSEVLLGKVDDYPERAVDGGWATEFLESKGQIEVTYSFKSLQVNSLSLIFTPPDGNQQLHYAFLMKPEEIDMGYYEDSYYAAFEIIPSLADRDGDVIYENTLRTELSWSKEEFEKQKSRPLLFTDVMPIIPGDFNFTMRVRNKVSRTYFLFSKTLLVPEPSPETFALSNLVLNYEYERQNESATLTSPFRFFNVQYKPSSTNEFAYFEKVHVFCSLYYPRFQSGLNTVGEIRFEFNTYHDDILVKKMTHVIPEERVSPTGIVHISRQLPFDDLEDGEYRLDVIASESRKSRSVARSVLFSIKQPGQIMRPNLLRLQGDVDLSNPEIVFARARQYLAVGNREMAMEALRRVLDKDSRHTEAVIKLGELLINSGMYNEAFDKLRTFERTDPNNRLLVMLIAQACDGKGDTSKAIGYYERLLFLDKEDVEVLNAVAELYHRTGRLDKARERWQKSLEINPDQPEIAGKLQDANS